MNSPVDQAINEKKIIAKVFEGSTAPFIIILINVYMFVFSIYSEKGRALVDSMVLYPGNLLEGNYLCVITSGFLHHNIYHLGLNMFAIFIFGRIVERELGVAKTLFVYLGALVISMLLAVFLYSYVFHKSVAIIGASGAVMGLLSAAMLLNPFCVTYEMILPLPVMFKGWLFIFADINGFLGGEKDGVAHLAHLLGYLSVGFLVYFLSRSERKKMRVGLIINIVSFILFILIRDWAIIKLQ